VTLAARFDREHRSRCTLRGIVCHARWEIVELELHSKKGAPSRSRERSRAKGDLGSATGNSLVPPRTVLWCRLEINPPARIEFLFALREDVHGAAATSGPLQLHGMSGRGSSRANEETACAHPMSIGEGCGESRLKAQSANGETWTLAGHLTKRAQVCICNEGWICEQHPDHGWPVVG
jgi:hypothetical protein